MQYLNRRQSRVEPLILSVQILTRGLRPGQKDNLFNLPALMRRLAFEDTA